MRLDRLQVVHLLKGGPSVDSGTLTSFKAALPADALHLDSCQRQLWAFETDAQVVVPSGIPGLSHFEGADAYRFLLRVATGLESQIVGETDIFGQLKEAWRASAGGASLGGESARSALFVVMQKLFEDTKDIRSRYLQNLGGASYGSLVRMLLKSSQGPTLIVGAGQIAKSVAPYLLEQELWLVNRSPEKAQALRGELLARAAESNPLGATLAASRIRIISPEEEARAWREAADVVLCIPFDVESDARRLELRGDATGPVIHLGGRRAEAGAWNGLAGFQALDDIFALQKAQGDVRTTQVQQAARACDEKAKLRTLGASVTIPHGWEDLALFA